MTKGAKQESTDFGFDPRSSPYHFAVVVERDAATVRIEERFALPDNPDPDAAFARPPLIKANLDSYRWSRVAEAVRADFNRRIVADGGPGAKWRSDETLLAPYLGKELTLLFWVIEERGPHACSEHDRQLDRTRPGGALVALHDSQRYRRPSGTRTGSWVA